MESGIRLLTVDIGNTDLHLGLYDGDELRASWRLSADLNRTVDDYGALLTLLFARDAVEPGSIDAAVVGSVVPPLLPRIERVVEDYVGVTPLVVRTGIRTGVRLVYDPPFELGADRIAHAVAAERLYGTPAIVVDFGTATTFDAIGKDGAYVGGAIAPGLSIAAEALWHRTAQLSRIDLAFPDRAIARNTAEAVQSGLMFGHLGLTREMVARFRQELDGNPIVIATGEAALELGRRIPEVSHIDTHLSLQGLRLIHELNAQKSVA
ncbi:MAG TPA: type III pantothenate kinase [Chloroflexota bacterium]|nr:type III pantothenate kinase [Chloroflexota bacterium]